jgi:hypothetical protein
MKCYKCRCELTKKTASPSVLRRTRGWCRICAKKYRTQHAAEMRLYFKRHYATHGEERSRLQQTFSFRHARLVFFLKKTKVSKSDPLWRTNFFIGLLSFNGCHYCLGPLGIRGYSLDKVDPRGSYSANNVVPCCVRCNRIKLDHLTYGEMMEFVAPALRKLRESKETL